MKSQTIRRFAVFVSCLSLFTLALAGCSLSPQAMDVEQAIKEQRVAIEFSSRGSYGDIIVATSKLADEAGESVNVSFPVGLALKNGDDQRESFVVFKYKGRLDSETDDRYDEGSSLGLSSAGSPEYGLLEAYSINAFLDSPAETDRFTAAGKAEANVMAVLEADRDVDNIEARQMAVWAVTDDITTQDLDDLALPYDADDLAVARKLIEAAKLDPASYALFQ